MKVYGGVEVLYSRSPGGRVMVAKELIWDGDDMLDVRRRILRLKDEIGVNYPFWRWAGDQLPSESSIVVSNNTDEEDPTMVKEFLDFHRFIQWVEELD